MWNIFVFDFTTSKSDLFYFQSINDYILIKGLFIWSSKDSRVIYNYRQFMDKEYLQDVYDYLDAQHKEYYSATLKQKKYSRKSS